MLDAGGLGFEGAAEGFGAWVGELVGVASRETPRPPGGGGNLLPPIGGGGNIPPVVLFALVRLEPSDPSLFCKVNENI